MVPAVFPRQKSQKTTQAETFPTIRTVLDSVYSVVKLRAGLALNPFTLVQAGIRAQHQQAVLGAWGARYCVGARGRFGGGARL